MNKESFDDIYNKYYRLALKGAFKVCKDHSLAQDICQEVFFEYYRKSENLEDNMVKPWMLVNTTRRAIDFMRKSYYKKEVVTCSEEIAEFVSDYGNLEVGLREEELRQFRLTIFTQLKKKNPLWYELITRVTVEQENPEKVADELGITIGNLRTKIHRAKLWISKQFQKEYESLK